LDVDKLQAMFSEFCESPAISATLPLRVALGYASVPKLESKYDSNQTVISTICPSDYMTEDHDSLTTQVLGSFMKPSEEEVWASIRKQSVAKDFQSDAKASSHVVHMSNPARLVESTPSSHAAANPTRLVPPALPTACKVTNTTTDDLFVDAEILGQGSQVFTSLASWLGQCHAQGRKMSFAQAAELASNILSQADAAVVQHGSAALRAVQCNGIFFDKDMNPHLQLDSRMTTDSARENLVWLSPEEIVGDAGNSAVWAAVSYRIGLLLHCVAVSGSPDPYPDRNDTVVVCGLLRAANRRGAPEEPFGLRDSSRACGSSSSRLMDSVISSCLRLSRPGPPDRSVVETSLAFLSKENKFSV